MRIFPSLSLLLPALLGPAVASQPRLLSTAPETYQVGDRIDAETFVLDRERQPRRILDLVRPGTRVLVLVLFGGAHRTPPAGEPFRGPLWCEDSFDDLGVQRALVRHFQDRPVQFLPVAVPPVYNPTRYGYPDDVFLGKPEDSRAYRSAVKTFIARTEEQRRSGLLPFGEIFYDPKFRLAQNRRERTLGPEYGTVYPWQGKLRWQQDPRKYGTPILWILSPDGTVLQEPFFANDYDSSPPQISYGFLEVKAAIEKWL